MIEKLLKAIILTGLAFIGLMMFYLIYHDITTPHCVEYKAVTGNIVCVKFQ